MARTHPAVPVEYLLRRQRFGCKRVAARVGAGLHYFEQEFLIHQSGDVRQQPSPFVLWHEEAPMIDGPLA